MLLFEFAYAIVRRLIRDAYYRALGTVLLMMLLAGTLFFWLAEGRTFLQAFAFSAGTMAMNTPYGAGGAPTTVAGVVFFVFYLFLSAGLFLLFVLETGKTMVQSYEDFSKKMAARKARARGPESDNNKWSSGPRRCEGEREVQ